MRRINLSFFGGGGSSKETVKTHSEKSDYLKNMDAATYKFFQPIANKYGGLTLGDVGVGSSDKTVGDTLNQYGVGDNASTGSSWLDDPNNLMAQGFAQADQTYLNGMQNANNLINASGDYLTKQSGVTDEATEAARKVAQQQAADMTRASGYLDEYDNLYGQFKDNNYGQGYLDSANNALAQLADLTNNANNNQAIKNYMSGVSSSIYNNFNKQAGNAIANAAARGIVNSTTSNNAISDLERNTQNTVAAQFADAFNKLSTNYNNLATQYNEEYKNYGDSMRGDLANILSASNQAATNAKFGAESGKQGVDSLLSAASGYGDLYKNALSGIDANQTAASKAYTSALAPVMSAYQYWRDLNTDHTNQDTEDTIVTSGGK